MTRRSPAARVLAAAARTFGGRLQTRFGQDPVDTMVALAADVRARDGRVAEIRYVVREITALIHERRRSRSPSPRGGITMLEPLRHDLRWTLRLARRRPLGSLTVALTLAVTIAAATTAYGLATAVLWRPLPFDAPDRLVLVWEGSRQDDGAMGRVTSSRYADWRDHGELVASLAAFSATGSTIDAPDGARAVFGIRVTANYFDTLGIGALVGRTFLPEEEQPGRTDVVVLSHAFWQEQFGGRPDAVGETLRLGGRPFTVIGVMPPVVLPGWPRNPAEVTLDPAQATYWVPIPRTPEFDAQARSHVYGVLGRLAPGATREAAEAQLAALASPDSPDPHGAVLRPLRDQFVRDARRPLAVLLAAALAVLLIACANLAAVQVTVMQTRRDEMAVRTAIGAGRRRLARQLLTESLVLALAGGAAGLLLAQAALALAPGFLPSTVPLLTAPRLDLQVALFGGGVALVCGLFVAAWPVAGVAGTLPTHRASSEPRRGVYRTLVVGQIAVTVPLVAAAALLAQSLWTVRGREAGFAIDHVLVADLGLTGGRYVSPDAVVAFEDLALPGIAALPGVRAAALSYDHPLEANWWDGYTLAGDVRGTTEARAGAQLRIVSPGYFEALDVQLLDGRLPEVRDGLGAPGVAVVNQAFAAAAPVQPVVGRRLAMSTPRLMWSDDRVPGDFEIIGVVEDERFNGLETPSEPAVYLTTRQFPQQGIALVARTDVDPASLAGPARAAIRDVDAGVTFSRPRSLASILDAQLGTRRITTDVVSGFAGLAVGLAALGLYGLLLVAVTARSKDFGVRLALGAAPWALARGVIGESLRDAGIGIAIGLVLASIAGGLIRALLVDVAPGDPLTLAGVGTVLLFVAAASAVVPARRAAAVDPVRVLRGE